MVYLSFSPLPLATLFVEKLLLILDLTQCWAVPHRSIRPALAQLKNKEWAWSQQQRHQQFNGWRILHIWSQLLEQHPSKYRPSEQDMVAVFIPKAGRGMGGNDVGGFISYQVNQQRNKLLTAPLKLWKKAITNWGLGQVLGWPKVSSVVFRSMQLAFYICVFCI